MFTILIRQPNFTISREHSATLHSETLHYTAWSINLFHYNTLWCVSAWYWRGERARTQLVSIMWKMSIEMVSNNSVSICMEKENNNIFDNTSMKAHLPGRGKPPFHLRVPWGVQWRWRRECQWTRGSSDLWTKVLVAYPTGHGFRFPLSFTHTHTSDHTTILQYNTT